MSGGSMGNINRLVWNNSFSNDKRLHSNKEPYKKSCKTCKATIWMVPVKSGWVPYDEKQKVRHECKKKKAKKKPKKQKPCKLCGNKIQFKKINGGWIPHDIDGKRHRCQQKEEIENIYQHMQSIKDS